MNKNQIIYVVDDEPEVRKELRRLFDATGFSVETYESAPEFLAAYNSAYKGCLIIDVRMLMMCGPELIDKVNESCSEKINLLTKREREVIELIIAGKYNKEIAFDLDISISTVEAHRSNIMSKFQAKNLVELVKVYYQI